MMAADFTGRGRMGNRWQTSGGIQVAEELWGKIWGGSLDYW